MDVDDVITAAACFNLIAATTILTTILLYKKRTHSCWVRGHLTSRETTGAYNCLLPDLLLHDPAKFKNYIRMDLSTFDELFDLVKDKITKKDTTFRKAIPAKEKLIATLRILATGLFITCYYYCYPLFLQIPRSIYCNIIPILKSV
jgi:hypothetical protein